jgi:SAM-dependent methyltransferase
MATPEVYAKFGQMPAYIGTTSSNSTDEFYPMAWGLRGDGLYGVVDWPRLDLIYLRNHNDLVGKTWERHLNQFAQFVSKHALGNILEIGSGHGLLSQKFMQERLASSDEIRWHCIEPNPLNENNHGKLVEGWFPEDLPSDLDFHTVVHSHVFEHQESPLEFAASISRVLPLGGRVVFSIPNMSEMAENLDLNMLMFEHLTFLTETEAAGIMAHAGFELLEILYFEKHSVFMSFSKKSNPSDEIYVSKISHLVFRNVCQNFASNLKLLASKIERFFSDAPGQKFVFGAHVFLQYIIGAGLDQNSIDGILDNNPKKHGERLYGTHLRVINPNTFSFDQPASVVVPMASYELEVIEGLAPKLPSGSRLLGPRTGIRST